MTFVFRDYPDTVERDTIIFVKIDRIFEFNFVKNEIHTLFEFQTKLTR